MTDPEGIFQGTLVFTAPHMDDEALACGGAIARLPDKSNVHVIYATDGSKSPVPMFRWMGAASEDLPDIRKAEAKNAMSVLDVPEKNLHFLDYPDGELKRYIPDLKQTLSDLLTRLQPASFFIPFRYDRHPDHLALYKAGMAALPVLDRPTRIVEYFVYYRWRLIPGGDLRALINPKHLVQIDIRQQSEQKRQALDCYTSQTTTYFDWQPRPILPVERLEEVSRTPEIFLLHDPAASGVAVYSRLRYWIPLVHRVEPVLKKWKEWIKGFLSRRIRFNLHDG